MNLIGKFRIRFYIEWLRRKYLLLKFKRLIGLKSKYNTFFRYNHLKTTFNFNNNKFDYYLTSEFKKFKKFKIFKNNKNYYFPPLKNFFTR